MQDNIPVKVEKIIQDIWDEGHPTTNDSVSYKDFYRNLDKKVEYSLPVIFGFDFPCYGDESDRIALEKHILTDYYTRSICCTSVTRWMLFLKTRMDDIMPRYKALYEAQAKLILSDYLNPYHVDETKKRNENKAMDKLTDSALESSSVAKNTGEASNSTHNVGKDKVESLNVTKQSNTPQALSDAVDSGSSIPLNYLSAMATANGTTDNTYDNVSTATDSSKSNNESSGNSSFKGNETGNENTIEDALRIVKGNLTKDNNAKLFKDYQDAIMNIEKMISNDLSDLFYFVY